MDEHVTDKKTLDNSLINNPSYVLSFHLEGPDDLHGLFSSSELYRKLFAKNHRRCRTARSEERPSPEPRREARCPKRDEPPRQRAPTVTGGPAHAGHCWTLLLTISLPSAGAPPQK